MKGLEWSNGKVRPKTPRLTGKDDGVAAVPPPASEKSAPMQDAKTGRFVPGNTAYRRRMLKREQRGIATLAPASCAEWLRPHVVDGASYAMRLRERFDDPVLGSLVGDVADAHTMYRALLALAAKGDGDALREARAWLREHRSALATLSGLAGESSTAPDDGHLYVDAEANQ